MLTFTNIPYAILNNVVLMGTLWVIYQLAATYIKFTTKQLFITATLFQFLGALFFILNIFSFNIIDFTTKRQFSLFTISNPYSSSLQSVLPYLGFLYCIMLFILLLRMIYQYFNLQKIKISGDYTNTTNWLNYIAEFNIELPRHIKIGTSEKVTSPIVFGYLEPIILLPISICNQLSTQEIKFILLHELAHIIRQDYLINIITTFSKLVLWFNPFAYLFDNVIQLQREIACDQFVIENINAPVHYAKALFNLAQSSSNYNLQLSLGALSSNNQLLNRIQVLNKLDTKRSSKKSVTIFGIVVFMIVTFSFCFQSQPITTIVSKENKPNVVKKIQVPIFVANTKQANLFKHNQIKHSENKLSNERKSVIQNSAIPQNEFVVISKEPNLNYNTILKQTKQWIKAHENNIHLASYNETKDSTEDVLAERLLMSSIIYNYQLKKALLEQKLGKATDQNEAADYILNSKEWDEMVQYEKWAHEFLKRHQ